MQNIAEVGYQSATDAAVRRPDAVTVSTVHKAKGLEYPVVFIVDAEKQRFPGPSKGYSGWLPVEMLDEAIKSLLAAPMVTIGTRRHVCSTLRSPAPSGFFM